MKGILAAIAVSLALSLTTARAASADDLGVIQGEFEAGNYSTAMNTLRALISQNPANATTHYWLGRCYIEVHDYDNAVTEMEKATQFSPGSSEYHEWLGRAYGGKADRDRSFLLARRVKKEFLAAVQLDSSNIEARRDLEEYLLDAPWIVGGSNEDALTQVNEITKLDPLIGHLARANYLNHVGKGDQAIAEYNSALEMKPRDVGPYLEIADYYASKNDGAEVEKLVDAAAQVNRKDQRLPFYRGQARVLSGTDLTLAEEDLKSYLASSPQRTDWPSHAAARYWLGRLYEKEGNKMEAAEQYRAALQLDSHRKDARKQLDALEKSLH
ncbi:MAG TPA: tetratricopeptide repeat protein [Candidatus Acidoferrales bacterium]|nr:tetratricopeptide repeat protein [Candidatus Acidoferrales bacterium]